MPATKKKWTSCTRRIRAKNLRVGDVIYLRGGLLRRVVLVEHAYYGNDMIVEFLNDYGTQLVQRLWDSDSFVYVYSNWRGPKPDSTEIAYEMI